MERLDAKELFAEQIGEKAAEDLLTQIMEKVEQGASVKEIGMMVRQAFEKHSSVYKPEEAVPAMATGAAIGAATGTYMSK